MTDACAADLSRDVMTRDKAGKLRAKIRDLVRTIAIYLLAAAVSGASYAICASAWNGSDLVRWWLAAVLPVGLFIIGQSLRVWFARRLNREKQLDLFHS